ncbi:hypothetical protein [Loigolactobacillus binensis]|uniref:DUF3325 domain-containing protein n=1 Tax=Loigolactobacillus binensis TaxID=2559922 RepID=A0ABW3EGQ6_9LACO|nr:hypothetical protein [Loigolactobacillus binensis]
MFYYLCGFVTLLSALVSFGFSVAAYLKAKPSGDTSLTNAKYALSRSFAILLGVSSVFIFQSSAVLVVAAIIMIAVQLSDGLIGMKISSFKTLGPLLTALGNTLVLGLFLLN